jgi:transcription elongation factor Elf1
MSVAEQQRARETSALALLNRCPHCSSRELADVTPPAEDWGWWATLLCRACGHRWRVRS